ncbi:MAG: mechanosensitive ion channel family protein [Thiobacillaceae bacterium]
MDELVHRLNLENLGSPLLANLLVVLLAVVLIHLGAYVLLRYAMRAARRTVNVWDDAFVNSARHPLPVLIWVVGIAYALQMAHQATGSALFNFVAPARDVGVIVCLTWFLLRLIRNASRNILAERGRGGKEVDVTTIDALSKLGRLTLLVIAALVALQTLGYSIAGILTFGGIGGIAIAFAAKDLLANFFGGLTIYTDRPFVVGEWIRSPDKDIEGTVEYIGWRHTRVRAFNKNPIYVPNALFTTIVVENPTRMTNRRIKQTIGVRYQDLQQVPAIVSEVRTMLMNHPEIDADATLIVNFDEFGESSLNFFIYAFTKTTQWVHFHEIKQDVLLKVAAIIDQHGAEIAFPTRTLHIEPAAAGSGPAN